MERWSRFSYACHQCGRCCHEKVITISSYDLLRIARAAGITTGVARTRYTIRRGSILRFADSGCVALDGVRCTIHRGRPLACRLYPLGLERQPGRSDRFVELEPAAGSAGVYGEAGTVDEFLLVQGVEDYLRMNQRYATLLGTLHERVRALVDFEQIEPREFWRCAVREALAEANYDANPLIDAMFDPDGIGCARASDEETVEAHIRALEALITAEFDAAIVAATAVMLGVSLGYSPAEVIAQA